MSWDAYNRRTEAQREVLAEADRRRESVTITELMQEIDSARNAYEKETELLLDIQMKWYQKLSGQIDRELTYGSDDLETAAIDAWTEVALQSPGTRILLDQNEDRAELRKAMNNESLLLAGAAGIHSKDRIGQGQRIKESAREHVCDIPRVPDTPASLFSRLRAALAA